MKSSIIHFSSMMRSVLSFFLAFILTISPSLASAATPAASYSFDETSGTAADSSGNGNSANVTAAERTAGKNGNAVWFSATGQKVVAPVSPQTAIKGSMTLEAWIHPTSLPTSAKPIFVKSASWPSNFVLQLQQDKLLWKWGGGSKYYYSTASIQVDTWQHVALTYDAVSKKATFYVNGIAGGVAIENLVPTAIAGPLYIGSSDSMDYFPGGIDDVRIYASALSQDEIRADMNARVSGGGTPPTTPVPPVVTPPVTPPIVVPPIITPPVIPPTPPVIPPTLPPVTPPTATGSIDAVIASMPANSWKALTGTMMKNVCPAPYDYWQCQAVVSAWGGGAYDEKNDRMLIFWGGHGDSWYNNLFSFDLSTMKWNRLTEMPADVTGKIYPKHWYDIRPESCGFMPKATMKLTPDLVTGNYITPSKCFVEPIASQLDFQQPRSSHTYGELFVDRIGNRFCSVASSSWPSAQTGSPVVHCYDFQTKRWERAADRPDAVGAGRGNTALDKDGNIWSIPGNQGYLGKYSSQSDSWTKYGYINYESMGGTDIDRKRNQLYTAHNNLSAPATSRFQIRKWDLHDVAGLAKSKAYKDMAATGDIPTIADVGTKPGFVYADAYDRFFVWGNGKNVYSYDPATMVWTRFAATGDNPGAGMVNGTYGRFRYSQVHGVFVLVNSTVTDVYIYRPGGTPTTPPVTPPNPPPVTPPVTPPVVPVGTITSFVLTSPVSLASAPFIIGQPFREGDIPSGSSIVANIPDFQSSVKTRWPDGSVKFAILSGRTALQTNTPLRINITNGTVKTGVVLTENDLKAKNANMLVSFGGIGQVELSNLIGKTAAYSATLGQFSAGKTSDWVSGPEMSSWIYSSPIGTDPSLTAWFEVRLWKDGQVEILPWLENGYLKKAGTTEKIGTATVSIGGVQKFSQSLNVYHHTRTPLVSGTVFSYWLGADPKVTFRHDTAYFEKTKLVPTYGAELAANSPVFKNLATSYVPFGQANYPTGMGSAGYHSSIGLLPEWDVSYLTSNGDPRSLAAVLVHAYSAGRYGTHYRDEKTNRPIKFSSYPNLALGSAANIGISGYGVSSAGDYTRTASGGTPPTWTTSHAPSVGYLAYLLQGRYYFMEESQFAGTTIYLKQTDTSRQKSKGILLTNAGANTTRGAGWGLRTYAHAELVTPDSDELKSEFTSVLNENIGYYYHQYVAKPGNPLGVATPYSDYSKGDNVYMHAAWMEGFLTAAMGYIMDVKAHSPSESVKMRDLFFWKAKETVGRLGRPGIATEYDFRDAAVYTVAVAPSDTVDWANGTGPWYKNWGEAYRATLGTKAGTAQPNMLRGAYFPEGSSYWGNLQPAISYAVTNKVPGAAEAYARMTGASNWPQFVTSVNDSPEWSVVPSAAPVPPVVTPPPVTPPVTPPTNPPVTPPTTPPTLPPPPANGALPNWVSKLPLMEWYQIPGTPLSSVAPAVRPLGITGPSSKIGAWNGAGLKRTGSVYMIGAAGGHGDYAGNEVDALALNTENPKWVELRAPSKNSDVINAPAQFYLDLRPSPTHTYYATQFIDQRNRLFVMPSPGISGSFPKMPENWAYTGGSRTFSFNMTTNDWDTPDYIAPYTGGGDFTAGLTVKHPVTGDVYMARVGGNCWRWNQSENTWTDLKVSGGYDTNYAGSAIDPIRNRMLIVGDYSGKTAPRVRGLDGKSIAVTFKGLGADALKLGGYPGVVYDEINDTYLVFFNSGRTVRMYRVNAATFEVDEPIVSGGYPGVRQNGIHNSVQYVPELGGVVIANTYNGNVYFMRTSKR